MSDLDFNLSPATQANVAPAEQAGFSPADFDGVDTGDFQDQAPQAPQEMANPNELDFDLGNEKKAAPKFDANQKTIEVLIEQNKMLQQQLMQNSKPKTEENNTAQPEAPKKDLFENYTIAPQILELLQKGNPQQAGQALMHVLKDFAGHLQEATRKDSLDLTRKEIEARAKEQEAAMQQAQVKQQIDQMYYGQNADLNNKVGRTVTEMVVTEMEKDPRFVAAVNKYGFMSPEIMGLIAKNSRARIRAYYPQAPRPMTAGAINNTRANASKFSPEDF